MALRTPTPRDEVNTAFSVLAADRGTLDRFMVFRRALAIAPVVLVLAACSAITGPATWTHDPAAEIGPNTIEFTAWVTETDCASGQSSEGRIVGPDIRVSPAAVVLTFRVRKRSLFGAEECPSNPATPVVVHLPEPLGDRPLLDGGREPPAEPPVCGNRNSCE